MKIVTKIVNKENANNRADVILTNLFENKSRNYVQKLFLDGNVTINGTKIPSSKRLKEGLIIEVSIPEMEENQTKKENIPLDIIYEDDDLLVINKPQGMVVHPANGHHSGTLVNALMYKVNNLSGINGKIRPGIVHRIDKDTSGLLVVAKNDFAHEELAKQLKDHSMAREYYALVKGEFKEDKGKIIAPIGRSKKNRLKMAVDPINGKDATTMFEVKKRYKDYTFLHLKLLTGRTHQIRVHLSYIGHCIVGDEVYGKPSPLYKNGQLLHGFRLRFIHPRSHKEMLFESPLPKYFAEVLTKLIQ